MTDFDWFVLTAIKASMQAGKAIMEIYTGDFSVTLKSDQSPLTEADRQSHEIIKSSLAFTGLPFLSEESAQADYSNRQNWVTYWLVDPLDGTKEFVHRNGEFTVNIALIEKGYPAAGVIYAPVNDLLYFTDTKKSYRISNAYKYYNINELHEIIALAEKLPCFKTPGLTILASRSHMNEQTEQFIHKTVAANTEYEMVSKGSSLKFCAIAEGTAHLYPRFGPTMEWDTAAGQAIAEKAGCKVVQASDGSRLRYNKESLRNPDFIVYGS